MSDCLLAMHTYFYNFPLPLNRTRYVLVFFHRSLDETVKLKAGNRLDNCEFRRTVNFGNGSRKVRTDRRL